MLRTFARASVGVAVLGATVAVAGPASADAASGTSAGACGGASYCVEVSYSGSAAPSGGGGGGYVATVAPDCWWGDPVSVEQALKEREEHYAVPLYTGKEWVLGLGETEQYKEALKQDPQPLVYTLDCRDGVDPEVMNDYAGVAAHMRDYDIPNMVNFIPRGQQPPPPRVSVETLRDAAYDSIDIPDPAVQRNPEAAGSGATLVNLPTQFWADNYDQNFDITASVGPVSATVVAAPHDFTLISPAGGQSCTADLFTTPFPGGADATGCNFPFLRSSNGQPGGFEVTISGTWGATWTGNPAPSAPQTLDPVSTSSTTNVPVVESQAIVDAADGDGNR